MQWKDFQSLRECPFCGGENIAVGSDKGTVYRRNTAFGDLTRSVPTVRWAYCVDCGCVAPAEKVNNFDGFYKPDEQEDALNRAISAWNRRAQPTNEPLTLEQLRGMDGDYAYFQFGDGAEGNAIIEWQSESKFILYGPVADDHSEPDIDFINTEFDDPDGHFGLHILGWRAYRRKPGGEQT
jgi:hypothetical protein